MADDFSRRLWKARAAQAFVTTGDCMSFREVALRVSSRLGREPAYTEGAARSWFYGTKPPDSDVRRALAAEFGVSYDWLDGKTNEGEPKLVVEMAGVTLTAEERALRAQQAHPDGSGEVPRAPASPPHPARRVANGAGE